MCHSFESLRSLDSFIEEARIPGAALSISTPQQFVVAQANILFALRRTAQACSLIAPHWHVPETILAAPLQIAHSMGKLTPIVFVCVLPSLSSRFA